MFFHGSEHKINNFTDDFVGGKEAHDQEGPGIYFTSSWKNARSYGPYVYTVKLNPKKFVSTQDGKSASLKEIEWLMKKAPNWKMHAENFNENPSLGVKIAAKNVIEYNDNPHQQFLQVWIDFYKNNPVDYVRNMVKLGYDSVKIEGLESIIAGEGNITHIIVLNPKIIEFVEMKDDSEESKKIEEANNFSEYVYHGTSKGAAYKIQREGKMKSGQASGSPSAPLFFSNQEQYASTYASRKDSSGGFLLRLKKTPDMKVATNVSNENGYVEYYTFREISSKEIEIKTGDIWIPISEFSFINEVFRKFVRKTLSENFKKVEGLIDINEIRNGKPEVKTVYHGTNIKHLQNIESKGLQAGSMGYQSASWYMVSTDFESALFHATAENGQQAPVIEFEVPVDNIKWEGHPYFWPPYERSENSSWFALKEPLPVKFIKKVHYVSYEDFLKQKQSGF